MPVSFWTVVIWRNLEYWGRSFSEDFHDPGLHCFDTIQLPMCGGLMDMPMMTIGQIPLDGHGPDQTQPDKCPRLRSPTRSPTCLVLAKFHYRGPTRLCRGLSQKNPPRKTRPSASNFLTTIVFFLPLSHSDMCSIHWVHFAHN